MSEAPKEIWAEQSDFHFWSAGEWFAYRTHNRDQTSYTRTDLFTRALSAAKEAAAELDALSTAYGEMRGTADILAMVKKEIEELEGE